MRRSLPLVLLLTLALIVAACGGGGDDDDQTPTATSGATTATTASGATATASSTSASGATETSGPGSGTGSGTGPGSGAGGTSVPIDATPTAGAAPATATRRPATVVSTPRPIATQRPQPTTPPQPDATATEIPPTAEDGQLTIVMEEDFDAGTSDWFDTGTTDYNTTLEIIDGQYVITPDADSWQTLTVSPDESWFFADGLITADVSLEEGAEFGLVSRQMQDDAGVFYFYVCWLTPAGAAGCSTYVDGEFTQLFRVDDPALFLDLNTMLLQVIGTELIFEVNGTQIGAIDDTTIEAGYWGFYIWGDANIASSRVDYVAIAVP